MDITSLDEAKIQLGFKKIFKDKREGEYPNDQISETNVKSLFEKSVSLDKVSPPVRSFFSFGGSTIRNQQECSVTMGS